MPLPALRLGVVIFILLNPFLFRTPYYLFTESMYRLLSVVTVVPN
jgi:hypothetical protein